MPKYRKKPVVIEAIQWTGENIDEIKVFTNYEFMFLSADGTFDIFTLEGKMKAIIGDWIIKGINGEFYPCKPDIFNKTYEVVSE